MATAIYAGTPSEIFGAANRHIVNTSNGWIIVAFTIGNGTSGNNLFVYKSSDGGASFQQLFFISGTYTDSQHDNFSMVAFGNTVTLGFVISGAHCSYTFDVTTVTNVDKNASRVVITTASNGSSIGLAVKSTGVVGAVVLGFTSAPNTYHVRYYESTTNAVTAWSGPTTLYSEDTSAMNGRPEFGNPSLTMKADNPIIDIKLQVASGTNYNIKNYFFNGSTWSATTFVSENPSTMIKTNLASIIKKNGSNIGRKFTVWDDNDWDESNISGSYSDDSGATHTQLGYIVPYHRTTSTQSSRPAIAESPTGDIYVFYNQSPSSGVGSIRYVVCPNGSTTFGSPVVFASSVLTDSNATICVVERAMNNVMALMYETTTGISYDKLVFNTAPTAPTPTAPANGGYQTNVSSVVFNWNFNDPDPGDTQSAFYIETSTTSNFAAIEYNTGWVASSAITYNWAGTWAQGVHYWRMYTKDAAGAQSPLSVVWSFTMDSVAPTIGSVDGMQYKNAGATVRVTAYNVSDPAPSSGLSRVGVYWRYSSDGGTTWGAWNGEYNATASGANYYYDFPTASGNGKYDCHFRAYDNAGNLVGPIETFFYFITQNLFFGNEF